MSINFLVELISTTDKVVLENRTDIIYDIFDEQLLAENATDQARIKIETKISSLLRGEAKLSTFGVSLANLYLNSVATLSDTTLEWVGSFLLFLNRNESCKWDTSILNTCRILDLVRENPDKLRQLGHGRIHEFIKCLLALPARENVFIALSYMMRQFPSQSRQYEKKLSTFAKEYSTDPVHWRNASLLYAHLPLVNKDFVQAWNDYANLLIASLKNLGAPFDILTYNYKVEEQELVITNARFIYCALAGLLATHPSDLVSARKRKLSASDLVRSLLQNCSSNNVQLVKMSLRFMDDSFTYIGQALVLDLRSVVSMLCTAAEMSTGCMFLAISVLSKILRSVVWLDKVYYPLLFRLSERALLRYEHSSASHLYSTNQISAETNALCSFFKCLINSCDQIADTLRTKIDVFMLFHTATPEEKSALVTSVSVPGKYSIASLAVHVINNELDSIIHPPLPVNVPCQSTTVESAGFGAATDYGLGKHQGKRENDRQFESEQLEIENSIDGKIHRSASPETRRPVVTLPNIDFSKEFNPPSTTTLFDRPDKRIKLDNSQGQLVDTSHDKSAEQDEHDESDESDGEFVMPTITMDSD